MTILWLVWCHKRQHDVTMTFVTSPDLLCCLGSLETSSILITVDGSTFASRHHFLMVQKVPQLLRYYIFVGIKCQVIVFRILGLYVQILKLSSLNNKRFTVAIETNLYFTMPWQPENLGTYIRLYLMEIHGIISYLPGQMGF